MINKWFKLVINSKTIVKKRILGWILDKSLHILIGYKINFIPRKNMLEIFGKLRFKSTIFEKTTFLEKLIYL